MKSRGVYETPGGTILMHFAPAAGLILDRETMTKENLAASFTQVVYEGKWYTPLSVEAIQAFVESTQICYR